MSDAKRLAFARERQVSLRYLMIGVGVFLSVFGLKFIGYTFGAPQVLFTGMVAAFLLILVTMVLGAAHARENGGVLITILLVFLPALAEREFDILFDIGHPNPGVLYGVWLALLFAIPVGLLAFVIGQRL